MVTFFHGSFLLLLVWSYTTSMLMRTKVSSARVTIIIHNELTESDNDNYMRYKVGKLSLLRKTRLIYVLALIYHVYV